MSYLQLHSNMVVLLSLVRIIPDGIQNGIHDMVKCRQWGFLQARLHDLCQFLTLSCILLGDPFWHVLACSWCFLHVEIIVVFTSTVALLVLDEKSGPAISYQNTAFAFPCLSFTELSRPPLWSILELPFNLRIEIWHRLSLLTFPYLSRLCLALPLLDYLFQKLLAFDCLEGRR